MLHRGGYKVLFNVVKRRLLKCYKNVTKRRLLKCYKTAVTRYYKNITRMLLNTVKRCSKSV